MTGLGFLVILAAATDRTGDHPAPLATPLPPPPGFIAQQNFGARWPFTIPSGVLSCDQDAIVLTADGVRYAVNGRARSRGSRGIEEIWKFREGVPGRMDLTEIFDRGRRVCP